MESDHAHLGARGLERSFRSCLLGCGFEGLRAFRFRLECHGQRGQRSSKAGLCSSRSALRAALRALKRQFGSEEKKREEKKVEKKVSEKVSKALKAFERHSTTCKVSDLQKAHTIAQAFPLKTSTGLRNASTLPEKLSCAHCKIVILSVDEDRKAIKGNKAKIST